MKNSAPRSTPRPAIDRSPSGWRAVLGKLADRRLLVAGALVTGAFGCGGGFGGDFSQGTPLPPAFDTGSAPATPPPPISGGTLITLRDGHRAAASDPDRDLLYIVDLDQQSLTATIKLTPGDEPGRLVEDAAGRIHVALRSGQALATYDPSSGALTRRAACPVPRGVAYDPKSDSVHVACAGGELVTLPAAGGDATRTLRLERDLRDVVVDGDTLLVSKFKTAELLTVAADGTVANRLQPGAFQSANVRQGATFQPAVAWRTIGVPGGGALMLHQRGQVGAVTIDSPGGYGGGGGDCDSSIVHSTVTRLGGDGSVIGQTPFISSAVLAVDMAYSSDGTRFALVSAGNSKIAGAQQVFELDVANYGGSDCAGSGGVGLPDGYQPTAVAYRADGALVVQTREPAALHLFVNGYANAPIVLSHVSVASYGHDVFHSNSGGGIACASCHPEGGEDGRTWEFEDKGARRTMSIRGGIKGTEPFHWDGDETDFHTLVNDVFVNRMGGPTLANGDADTVENWIETIPLLHGSTAADAASIERGRVLFTDNEIGCSGCHSGAKLTNNTTVDVGTGSSFQVPSLRGVAFRAPFLHDGCAPTLRDRFGACGGASHGSTRGLQGNQIQDLISYLETL